MVADVDVVFVCRCKYYFFKEK